MSTEAAPARRRTTALLLTTCLTAATGAGLATAPAAGAAQQQAVRMLEATLRPGGDPDGSGQAHLRLFRARGKVCAHVEWSNIDAPTAAHIHRRSDGGVVVDLSGSVTAGANCATDVRKRLVARILEHPRRYYFNVHNTPYPAGAIQGRLHR